MNSTAPSCRAVLRSLLRPYPPQAQLTTISASSINFGGVPVSAGTVTFTPVNTQGIAIAFAQGAVAD